MGLIDGDDAFAPEMLLTVKYCCTSTPVNQFYRFLPVIAGKIAYLTLLGYNSATSHLLTYDQYSNS